MATLIKTLKHGTDVYAPRTVASAVLKDDGVTTVQDDLDSINTTLLSKVEQSDIDTAIAGLVDTAPATLDTLNELAAALGDDANFATTVTNALADRYTEAETDVLLDGKADLVPTVIEQSGTSYTLSYSSHDEGKVFTLTNETSCTITIPTNAVEEFPIGSQIAFIAIGAGTYTISADTGVSLNLVSAGSEVIDGQTKSVAIIKVLTDAWIIAGAIA